MTPGRPAQLLDVVEGRSAAGPSGWIVSQPLAWRAGIRFGVLDLSGPYRKTFDDVLPEVLQVADPFHLVKLANTKLDECRRRVQNDTLGHYAGDPVKPAGSGVLQPVWVSMRSRSPSKIFCRPSWPLRAASSRWRCRVGLNSMVVTKKVQDSQMDS